MSDDSGTESTRPGQAWASLADQFNSIAKQFRQHYDRVSASAQPEPDATGGSVQHAVNVAGKAIEDTARTIEASIRDPKVRQDSGQAGSALLRAVGATLTELGAALQRQADPPAEPSATTPADPQAVSTEPATTDATMPTAEPEDPPRQDG